MARLKERMNIQRLAAGQYKLSSHPDWSVGVTMFGGCVAAQLFHAASTHMATDPDLQRLNQPDIMTLHVEFLRFCAVQESTITISVLKTGKISCNLQLRLYQGNELKVLALATTTNFDISLGPTMPKALKPTHVLNASNMQPPLTPKPDFQAMEAENPQRDWLPFWHKGDLTPILGDLLALRPRKEHTTTGFSDGWNRFNGEQIDSTSLAFLGDFIPSMSQTLLQTGSPTDAKAFTEKARLWSEKNPGVPAVIALTLQDAMKSNMVDSTLNLTYEFKRRIPKEGIDWVYYRLTTNMLEKGRMDVHLLLFDKDYNLLCTCTHAILVLESGRKFNNKGQKASL